MAIEFPPLAAGDAPKEQWSEGDAFEALDVVTDFGKQVLYGAATRFSERDPEQRLAVLEADDRHGRRLIFGALAGREPPIQFLQRAGRNDADDRGLIGPQAAELWVRQLVGHVPVVGQEQEAGGVIVKASDREEPGPGVVTNQIDNGQPVRARLIRGGAECARGLVEHDVDGLNNGLDGAAVDQNAVGFGIDPERQVGEDLAVDPDLAFLDELLAGASRGDAGIGQDTLEALAA